VNRAYVILWLVCMCVMPSFAAAQDDAFKQGLQARGDKKWADVVRHMQNALRADAQESTRKVGARLGVGGTEYLPHFFLGEAYYNQQDCGIAVTEWSISEQQGAVKSKPEFLGTLKAGSQACAAKGVLLAADYNPLYQSTSKVYGDAAALSKRISDIGTANRDVWRPDVDEQFGRAKKELEASFARLNAGQRSRLPADFNEAKAASERATAILRSLEVSLNGALEALNSVQRHEGHRGGSRRRRYRRSDAGVAEGFAHRGDAGRSQDWQAAARASA
jgi:hypothetical protein